LVNNAGAMFGHRQLTTDGLERTFALNHVVYFLLTALLLERSPGERARTDRVGRIRRAPPRDSRLRRSPDGAALCARSRVRAFEARQHPVHAHAREAARRHRRHGQLRASGPDTRGLLSGHRWRPRRPRTSPSEDVRTHRRAGGRSSRLHLRLARPGERQWALLRRPEAPPALPRPARRLPGRSSLGRERAPLPFKLRGERGTNVLLRVVPTQPKIVGNVSTVRPVAEQQPISLPTERESVFDPAPELARLREEEPLRRLVYPD